MDLPLPPWSCLGAWDHLEAWRETPQAMKADSQHLHQRTAAHLRDKDAQSATLTYGDPSPDPYGTSHLKYIRTCNHLERQTVLSAVWSPTTPATPLEGPTTQATHLTSPTTLVTHLAGLITPATYLASSTTTTYHTNPTTPVTHPTDPATPVTHLAGPTTPATYLE